MIAEEFETAVRNGLQASRQGAMDLAARCLKQAMQLQPQSPLPHFLLGANQAEAGQNDLAEASYLACLAREPGFHMARFQLGLLQLIATRAVEAQATWLPLLELPDSVPLKLFAQGFLEIVHGNGAGAKALILKGIELNRDNAALNVDMLGVLSRLEGAAAQAAQAALEQPSADAGIPQPQAEEAGAPSADGHFLITAYQQS